MGGTPLTWTAYQAVAHQKQQDFRTHSARTAVDGRTQPDTTGPGSSGPWPAFALVRGRFCWLGGGQGIRTLEDGVAALAVFKTAAIGH
jgi:hypothetical protein